MYRTVRNVFIVPARDHHLPVFTVRVFQGILVININNNTSNSCIMSIIACRLLFASNSLNFKHVHFWIWNEGKVSLFYSLLLIYLYLVLVYLV